MDFSRTVEVAAPIAEVWALTADIEAVAGCIPGVRDLEMVGPGEFTCLLVQHVGSVKAAFALRSSLLVDEASRTVTASSTGQDRGLGSAVKAAQTFVLSAAGDRTRVSIEADVQITGRIATFGHRIIGAKAEQVTVEAIRNVDLLLASRRAAAGS
jgi:carbon monoxide dehydrogenase subunit G